MQSQMLAKSAVRKVLPTTKIAANSGQHFHRRVAWCLVEEKSDVVTECVSDAEQENIPVYYF